jgi:hypothetical protein
VGVVGFGVASPPSAALVVGDSVILTAAASAPGGRPVLDRDVAWSSSDTLVATVNAAGHVRARGVGSATVTAEVEGQRAGVPIVVAAPPPVPFVRRWSVSLEAPTTSRLVSVWESPEGNVYAVSDIGEVIWFDGRRWTATQTFTSLSSVWGSSDRDVYAVGANGAVLHFDGSHWRSIDIGTRETLHAVWGTAPDNLFVGSSRAVLHFDGIRWRTIPLPGTFSFLTDLWGLASGSLYVAASDRSVLRLDGDEWTHLARLPHSPYAIWGADEENLFVVAAIPGRGGVVYHLDGTQWRAVAATSEFLHDVWGASATEVYAVGERGTVLHFDGHAWSPVPGLAGGPELRGIAGAWPGRAVAVGWGGRVVRLQGGRWSEMVVHETLNDVWAASGSDVFVVGDAGTILRSDGGEWRRMPSGTMESLTGVWGRSPGEVYAVGTGGVLLRFDGRTWSRLDSGTGSDLTAIRGTADGDAIIAASGGVVVMRGTDRVWLPGPASSEGPLRDAWGSSSRDFYAVSRSTLHHYDGEGWRDVAMSPFGGLSALWGAPDGTIWVGGVAPRGRDRWYGFALSGGHLLELTEGRLRGVWTGASPLTGLWGSGVDQVFAVGGSGTLVRRRGDVWERVPVPTTRTLTAVAGSGPDRVWAVGEGGTILVGVP